MRLRSRTAGMVLLALASTMLGCTEGTAPIDVHELDYAEAAEALKVPIGTVKSRLARARLQMQKRLRGNFTTSYEGTAAHASCAA